jgi:two-component sensor histidine kinase
MTSGFLTGNLFRGLAIRVLFFLSLALLPIGLLAITQTQQIAQQYRENAELALISITEQASTAERQVLQEAFSAGKALASIVSLYWDDDAACATFLKAYQAANPGYALVGYIPRSGLMVCSSGETAFDFSDDPMLQIAIDKPQLRAQSLENGAATKRAVTVVTVPAYDADVLTGFVSLSIPATTFDRQKEIELPSKPLALMTFNKDGDVITTERGMDTAGDEVPADIALSVFTGQKTAVFEAYNQLGTKRIYVIQQIIPDAVHAISVWPIDTPLMNPSFATKIGTQLPIVMWLASLIVAFWALNRLAIRHIRKLGRQMRRFALNRNLPNTPLGSSVPAELVEMEEAFISMGESILRDEATLEDSLREKNILLKEVHHRVKNNLQLISSIMNMQIRQAKTDDARRVLQRLQERILSLATVHKNLYQDDNLVRVDAAILLNEVVNQLLNVGLAPGSNVKVTQDYKPVMLEADDAAPLTLLVSEAMTNALKYVGQNGGTVASINITLENQEADSALLTLTNTTGGVPDQEGTGLGSRLITAFARQLNGQVEMSEKDGLYTLQVSFPVLQDDRQVYDY